MEDLQNKLKLASTSLTDRIKTGSAQFSRTLTTKVKDILQTPTPESKIVDEATSETLNDEPNWGLNLRICAMIGRDEYDGTEIVKAIKKKLGNKGSPPGVCKLSLELLETCTSNCEKVFAAVASEKVLDDVVGLVEDPGTEDGVRVRALGMIRAWGESEELDYLPVFRQTYMNLKSRGLSPTAQEENLPSMQHNLESYFGQQPLSPPERYPVPNTGPENENDGTFYSYGLQSIEEKKEFLAGVRNTLDILSSISNSETEPKPLQDDDLTINMLEKCKESLPVIQKIIESTSDDEVMLFDALNLHDELQVVISKQADTGASVEPGQPDNKSNAGEPSDEPSPGDATSTMQPESRNKTEVAENSKEGDPVKLSQKEENAADKNS